MNRIIYFLLVFFNFYTFECNFELNDTDCDQKNCTYDMNELLGSCRISEFCEKYATNSGNDVVEILFDKYLHIEKSLIYNYNNLRAKILEHLYIIYSVYEEDFNRVIDIVTKKVTFSYYDFEYFLNSFFVLRDDIVALIDSEYKKSSFLLELFNVNFICKNFDILEKLAKKLNDSPLYCISCWLAYTSVKFSSIDCYNKLLKLFFREVCDRGEKFVFYKELVDFFDCLSVIDVKGGSFSDFISDNNLCNIGDDTIMAISIGDKSNVAQRANRFKRFLDDLLSGKFGDNISIRKLLESNGYINSNNTIGVNFNLDYISFILGIENIQMLPYNYKSLGNSFREELNVYISFISQSPINFNFKNLSDFLSIYKDIRDRSDNFKDYPIINPDARDVQCDKVIEYMKKCMQVYINQDSDFVKIVFELIKKMHNNMNLVVSVIRFLGATMKVEKLDFLNDELDKLFSSESVCYLSFNNGRGNVSVYQNETYHDIFYKKMFVRNVFDGRDFVKLSACIFQHFDGIFENRQVPEISGEFGYFLDRYVKYSQNTEFSYMYESRIYFSDFLDLFEKYPEALLEAFVSYCVTKMLRVFNSINAVIKLDCIVNDENLKHCIKEKLIKTNSGIVVYANKHIEDFYNNTK